MDTNITAHKIFTNTAWQIGLRSIEIIMGVITLGLITRYLGQEGFGHYTTVMAFLQLFIIVIDFGLYLTLLREISSNSSKRLEHITNTVFTLRLISSTIFLSLACVVVFLSPYNPAIQWGVLAMTFGFLASSLISTLTALFQKFLHMIKIAAVTLLSRIILLGLTIYIIQTNADLQNIFYAASISLTIGFLLIWGLLRTLPIPIHLGLVFDKAYTIEIIKKTWPIAITIALNLIYFRADTIILSFFQSQESVGLYGASYRVVEIVTALPHMFMGLILPMLTAAWVIKDWKKFDFIWKKTFSFFAWLAFPLIAGTLILGQPIMEMIAGSQFAESGSILKILIIATVGIFFGTLYTYTVLVIEKQRQMIKYFAATAAIALAGYFILIPIFSYWGAAWMTVVSELLIIAGAWLVVRKEIKLGIPWIITGKLLISSLIMATATYTMQSTIPLIPLIIISAIIYFVSTVALKAVTIQDIKQLIKP